jgi:4-aminobutyrate aminotransferase
MPSWLSLYYEDPIEIVSGHGRHVYDQHGRQYLDFFGGILTTSVGHAIPEIVDAVREQAGKVMHTSTLYLIEPMIELAERLAEVSGIDNPKVFFTTSGTEANDAALLLATTFRQSNEILAIKNSYHGRSFAEIAVTGNRSWSPTSYSPFSVSWLQGGSRIRGPLAGLTDEEYVERGLRELEEVLETTTTGKVAALIFEPIQGVGGFTLPPDGYFGKLQQLLASTGTLLIADEVQTGFGRTGEDFWGYRAQMVKPDIITFAKGVANGLALGGVIARAEIMDSLGASSISTFGGNPLAARAGVAVFDFIQQHRLVDNAAVQGRVISERLIERVTENVHVAEVRGKGLMIGVELVEADGVSPSAKLAKVAMERARDRGILIGRGGLYGNVLRIAPPLSITGSEATEGAEILGDILGGIGG